MPKHKSLVDAFRPAPAPQPAGDGSAPAPETARPRRTLPVELAAIRTGKRLRMTIDTAKLETIADSMATIGLQSPILLRPWREEDPTNPGGWGDEDAGLFALVAGAHRLAAAQQLGWTRIEAIIVEGTPDEMRLVEIDENLARAELTVLDRARFLAARKAVHARLNPGHARGGDRKSVDYADKNQSPNIGLWSFSTEAMDRTGLSKSAVYRAVEIGEGLCEEAAVALADTPLADRESELHRLARMPAAKQRTIAGLCGTPAGPGTLEKALAMLEGESGPKRLTRRSTIAAAGLPALQRAWRAADADTRRRFLEWLEAGAKDRDAETKPAKKARSENLHNKTGRDPAGMA